MGADDASEIFLEFVAPSFGSLIAVLMFLSPMQAVLRIRREKKVGDFNIIPLPVTCANCAAWIAYGYVTKNFFMYPANLPGFLLSAFMLFSAYAYADSRTQDRAVGIFLGFASLLLLMGIFSVHFMEKDEREQAWGYTCVAILLVFYSAPLSTLAQVLRQRNSASLYLPSSVAALANGALWVAYGLAVGDYFIWGPNLAGVALSLVQIAMKLTIPSRPTNKRVPLLPETPTLATESSTPFADDAALLAARRV